MSTIDHTHLRLLAVYAAVVEAGSFAAAARRLHSSRSRVSEQVAQLETVLGVRLLQRSTRRLTLTHEGRRVYDQARQLPDILRDVEAIATPSEPSGRVALSMTHDTAHKFLLPRLPEFRRRYPRIHLDLMLDDARVDLIDEQIDLAIRVGFPRDDSVIARVLYEERSGVFASPDYLSRVGVPDRVEALQRCDWVLLTQADRDDAVHLRRGDQTVEIRPDTFTRCNSPLLAQELVAGGFGLGALLPSTVRTELAAGDLVPVMPELVSDPLVFSLIYPSRRQIPQRTRAVIDFVLAANLFGPR